MADSLNSSMLQSSVDFAGMASLRGQAQQKTEKATRDTATQFEALFIHEMLKSMRQTIDKSELNGSDAEDTFQEMYDRELSQKLAQRNTLGVADMLVKHLDRANAPQPAFDPKAEPTPIPLNVVQEGMAIQRTQPTLPLVRPDKFTIKPGRVAPVSNTGTE
jgi:Rod binding domain-containing protein